MSKYLNIGIALAAVIILAVVYFLGRSAGYDNGYIEGKAEVQVQLDDMTKQYNELVKTSNAKISLLEQQAYQASQEKEQLIEEYKKRIESLSVKDQSRAWSRETVQAINEVIK